MYGIRLESGYADLGDRHASRLIPDADIGPGIYVERQGRDYEGKMTTQRHTTPQTWLIKECTVTDSRPIDGKVNREMNRHREREMHRTPPLISDKGSNSGFIVVISSIRHEVIAKE